MGVSQDLTLRLSVRDGAIFRAELKEDEEAVKRVGDATDKQGASSRKAASDVDRHTKSLSSLRTELGKTGQGLKQLGVGSNGFLGRLFSVAGVTAVSLLASGVGSLGAASISTVGALAPLAGALAAIPAAALAGASAFGVFKLATSNLGGALKVLGDRTSTAQQIQQALIGLSPQAVAFVGQLNGIRSSVSGLRTDAQNALFPGLSAGLTAAVPALLPLADTAVKGVGGALGTAGRIAGQTLATPGVQGDLSTIVGANNKALMTLTKAVAPLITAFAHIGAALAPVEQALAGTAVHAAQLFSTWTAANTGKITSFFMTGIKMAENFGKGLWSLGGALLNVFHAATGAAGGKSLDQTFASWAQHLKDITGSTFGQASLRSYFDRALPVAHEFVSLLGDVALDIAKLGADTSLGNLIGALHTALPGISAAAQDIASMVSAIAGLDPNILKAIGAAGTALYVAHKLNLGGLTKLATGGKGITGTVLSALGFGGKQGTPVYVTNWPASFGSGSKLSTAEKDAEKLAAGGAGAKILTAGKALGAGTVVGAVGVGVQKFIESNTVRTKHPKIAAALTPGFSAAQANKVASTPGFEHWMLTTGGTSSWDMNANVKSYEAYQQAVAHPVSYSSLSLADLHGVHDINYPAMPNLTVLPKDQQAASLSTTPVNSGPNFNGNVTFQLNGVTDPNDLFDKLQNVTTKKASNQ